MGLFSSLPLYMPHQLLIEFCLGSLSLCGLHAHALFHFFKVFSFLWDIFSPFIFSSSIYNLLERNLLLSDHFLYLLFIFLSFFRSTCFNYFGSMYIFKIAFIISFFEIIYFILFLKISYHLHSWYDFLNYLKSHSNSTSLDETLWLNIEIKHISLSTI